MRLPFLTEAGDITERPTTLQPLDFDEPNVAEPFHVHIQPLKELVWAGEPKYVFVLSITTTNWQKEPTYKVYRFPTISGFGDRSMIDYRPETRITIAQFAQMPSTRVLYRWIRRWGGRQL